MKYREIAIASIFIVQCTGCTQQVRRANDALERENFQLEQKLDSVTYQLEDARAELEACRRRAGGVECGEPGYDSAPRSPRRNLDEPRRAPGEPDRGQDAAPIDRPPVIELPDEEPKTRGTSLPRANVPRFDGYPDISPPDPNVPDGILTAPAEPAQPAAAPRAHLREPELVPTPAPARDPKRSSRKLIGQSGGGEVAMFAVNPRLTVWRNDSSPTDTSALTVVVEPRDQAGKMIETTGDIAIVVLDPSKTGQSARVARWDYKSDESSSRFVGTDANGGFHFDLDWPNGVPKANKLDLYVRLTLANGRQFVAEYTLTPESDDAASALVPIPEGDDGPSFIAEQPRTLDAHGWQRARRQ